MRSEIVLTQERKIREEVLLQRRLSRSRRAASALMPTLRRTGLKAKASQPKLRVVGVKLRLGVEPIESLPTAGF